MTTLASMSLVRSPALTLTHGTPGLIYLEDLAPEGHSDGMIGRFDGTVHRFRGRAPQLCGASK